MSALKDELTNDPLGLGYAPLVASQDYNGLAEMLNIPRLEIKVSQMVPRHQVKTLLLGTGEILAIKASENAYAQSTMFYLNDSDYQNVDLTLPVVQGMLAALLSENLLTQDTVDAIQAMGLRPASRAEQLGLRVTDSDIANALNEVN